MDSNYSQTGFLAEVSKAEIVLWSEIHKNDVMSTEVREMYRKVCWSFEQIVFNDHELSETQEAEYSFWKLHYRQIDEFRKRMKRFLCGDDPSGTDSPRSSSSEQAADEIYLEGFKSFLSMATDVYTNLIVQIKRRCGISEPFSCSMESKTMQKHQFLWYRFLVCLGDLTRYKEICGKSASKNLSWSSAAGFYLEATRVGPDTGHAQNQLAVLATYVGDEFLALYHCIRSLAVKNPFPDSWNNLILLFEKNRSSDFYPFTKVTPFEFSKPLKSHQMVNVSNDKVEQTGHNSSTDSKFPALLIRLLSFFFLPSCGEDFSSTFAAMLKELDALLSHNEMKLNKELQSYQQMDQFRSGPYCILQVICMLLYAMDFQISKGEEDHDQHNLTCLVVVSTFIILGRLVDRCSKEKPELSPLLPAVLAFVERLPLILDRVEPFSSDGKVENSLVYFFNALVAFLSQTTIIHTDASVDVAIWEDFELRGFTSLSSFHQSIEYSSRQEHAENYKIGAQVRLHRIFKAAMRIGARTNTGKKWLFYDNTKQPSFTSQIHSEKRRDSGNGASVEEDEIILFKPLTRFNSAPIKSISHIPTKLEKQKILPADASLRRAMSLLISQNQFASSSSSSTQPDQIQSVVDDREFSTAISPGPPPFRPFTNGGPPSLNAWVIDEKKEHLAQNDDLLSASFEDFLIDVNEDFSSGSLPQSSTKEEYSSPEPSAPLLPHDATWFNATTPISSDHNNRDSFFSATPFTWSYQQPLLYPRETTNSLEEYHLARPLTSSEWLRHYRETSKWRPTYLPMPAYSTHLQVHDTLKPGLLHSWGNPPRPTSSPFVEKHPLYNGVTSAYVIDGRRNDMCGNNAPRSSPYSCNPINLPEPFFPYYADKDWVLYQDPAFRGPTYMGS